MVVVGWADAVDAVVEVDESTAPDEHELNRITAPTDNAPHVSRRERRELNAEPFCSFWKSILPLAQAYIAAGDSRMGPGWSLPITPPTV